MSNEPSWITSPQNARVKQAVKLRDRRARQRQNRILIDGLRELGQAIAGKVELEHVFYCPPLCQSDAAGELLQQIRQHGVSLFAVNEAVWQKLTFGQRREGLIAVAQPPAWHVHDLQPSPAPLLVVLDGVEKPGNIGAVCRTADAVAADAVVITDGRTDLFNPNAIRASLGTVFRVPLIAASAAETQDWLMQNQVVAYVAQVQAELDYDQADFSRPCALVLGSEAHGVGPAWQVDQRPQTPAPRAAVSDVIRVPVRLPMRGTVDSLNVSNTAAVLLYEAFRQRRVARGRAVSATP